VTTLTREQVRELDRRAIEEYGVPGVVLMENAGRGAAEVLMRLNPERRLILICCGAGNNGGDGFVIARHLDNRGYRVKVWLAADTSKLSADAEVNYQIVARSRIEFWACPPPALERPLSDVLTFHDGWIVDALFGTGLTGPVRDPYDRVIAAINAARSPVLAVDIPSGLDCDTGEPLGPTVRATHTVTFVAPKAGFANPKAREWLGEVHVADIGAPRALLEQYGIAQ
jgi:NAD(P)H-hydrate epimerase